MDEKIVEKQTLLPTAYRVSTEDSSRPRTRTKRILLTAFVSTVVILALTAVIHRDKLSPGCHGLRTKSEVGSRPSQSPASLVYEKTELCPQATPLVPEDALWSSLVEKNKGVYSSETFKSRAIAWLSGAVQVKCVPYVAIIVMKTHALCVS